MASSRSKTAHFVLGRADQSPGAGMVAEDLRRLGLRPLEVSEPQTWEEMKTLLGSLRAQAGARAAEEIWVHPGVSFWAERPELVHLAEELGLQSWTPSARALHRLQNVLNLQVEVASLGIPTLLATEEAFSSAREVQSWARKNRWPLPLVLRALRASERPGRWSSHTVDGWEEDLNAWVEELRIRTGEPLFVVQRRPEGARRVHVSFVRGRKGPARVLALADASLEVHGLTLVEQVPALGLDPAMERALRSQTEKLAETFELVGVGWAEFSVDGERAFLSDLSPRLGAGYRLHGDLVRHQAEALGVEIAPNTVSRPSLPSKIALHVHALDLLSRLPRAGAVVELEEPPALEGGLLESTFVRKQPPFVLSSHSSSWLGTLFCSGATRADALSVSARALEALWVTGEVQTNRDYLLDLVAHPWIQGGHFHESFLDEEFIPTMPLSRLTRPELQCILSLSQECLLKRTPDGGTWVIADRTVKLRDFKPAEHVVPPQWENGGYRGQVRVEGHPKPVRFSVAPVGSGAPLRANVQLGSLAFRVRFLGEGGKKLTVSSLVRGQVHALRAQAGSWVAPHQSLCWILSLGRLVNHSLPRGVTLERWEIRPDQEVEEGQVLAHLNEGV